jgi:uncharacterized protein YjaZ
MINVVEFSNEPYERQFISLIDESYMEMLGLLDRIPATLNIVFAEGASDMTGVGGFAAAGDQINLAVLEDFEDKALQKRNLQAVILHETFHIQQGFTFDKSPFSGLEALIYEGCAVACEKTHGGTASYADYQNNTKADLYKWLDELKQVGTEYFEDRETWQKWAYYHPDYDERWIIYKVGSFIIDELLKARQIDILDLKNKSADEIMAMLEESDLL